MGRFAWILLLSISLFFIACDQRVSNSIGCDNFKNGVFHIQTRPTDSRYVITRFDSIQTELDVKADSITFLKVKWLNSCEYEVTRQYRRKHTVTDTSPAIIESYKNWSPVKIKIKSLHKNFYVFDATSDESSSVYTDTMWLDGQIGGFKAIKGVFSHE